MKILGIIILLFGSLSVIGGLLGAMSGKDPHFGGLAFVILGAYLIHSANKKKEEAIKKKEWEEGNTPQNNTNDTENH